MESSEIQKQLSRVEEARGVISHAAQRIEDEFARSRNSWLECFGSSIFALETYLDSDKVKDGVGDAEFTKIMQKLNDLKVRHDELKQTYPDKETVPPEDIKQELLIKLNVLE
jgi:hypothetical protein